MKAVWLWLATIILVACSSPQGGAIRGKNTGGQTSRGAGGASGKGGQGTAIVSCNDVECDPNATCTGSGSSAKCACNDGYDGDGRSCTDIDECKNGKNDCDANATCENRPGSFFCKCESGYVGDGTSCKTVSACGQDTDTCDPNATCSAAKSGVSCTCNAGFTGDGNGCSDVDECAAKTFSCAANAHCVNKFGGYDCACDAGYSGDGNEACTSLCSAAKSDASVCAPNGLCRVEGTSAVCDACAPGSTGDGKTCTISTKCGPRCDGTSDDAPHAVCQSDGTCACAPGFSGTPGSCKDVDECATDSGGCGDNADCTNDTNGGYACSCKAGFAPDKTGACADVDECKGAVSPCHPDATCTNQAPSGSNPGYTCKCKPGFTGDGTVCSDLDECAKNNGGCDDKATCINTRGSSSCQCTGDLVGDPSSCHCDLSGIWAMRQDVDTCWKATPIQVGLDQDLISSGNVEATVWSISALDYDGKTVTNKGKGCGADRTPDLSSPYFHETYSSFVPFKSFDGVDMQAGASWDLSGLVPGKDFVTPSDAAVIGVDLGSDPLNAPWPAAHGDVMKWLDTDGDGEPGWTLWPHVPSETTLSGAGHYSYIPAEPGNNGSTFFIAERAGCISIAARVITHLEGTVKDCSHLRGTVINEKSEGRVHSCTTVDPGTCDTNNTNCTGWAKDITCNPADWKSQGACTDADIDRLDNDQNQIQNSKATFEMLKIGKLSDSRTCDDVRKALPAIKRVVPTITCTTPM